MATIHSTPPRVRAQSGHPTPDMDSVQLTICKPNATVPESGRCSATANAIPPIRGFGAAKTWRERTASVRDGRLSLWRHNEHVALHAEIREVFRAPAASYRRFIQQRSPQPSGAGRRGTRRALRQSDARRGSPTLDRPLASHRAHVRESVALILT